jgi:exoribonuclease R
VKSESFPKGTTAEDVAALFAGVGVTPAMVDVAAGAGGGAGGVVVTVVCPSEEGARALMQRNRCRHQGVEVTLSRGDGALLHVDELPPLMVQPVAKVVRVTPIPRERLFAGTLKSFGSGLKRDEALFKSKDWRVPPIIVPMADCPEGFADLPGKFALTLVVAKIDQWKRRSQYAHGRVVRTLGVAGDIDAETEAILLANGVETDEFPAEVLDSLPPLDAAGEWHIPPEELDRRTDFRDQQIFTIDPATARDLDDALSWEDLGNGTFKVGVHIADVSYFMKPDTPLDTIAARRATTTYLIQRCYPMLPRMLCENLCSLAENEDRLTFSIVWTLDGHNKVLDQWIGRGVIRSCAKLAYGHAQQVGFATWHGATDALHAPAGTAWQPCSKRSHPLPPPLTLSCDLCTPPFVFSWHLVANRSLLCKMLVVLVLFRPFNDAAFVVLIWPFR